MSKSNSSCRATSSRLALLAILLLLSLAPLPLRAQVRGDTEVVTHSMTFETSQTDVTLDPDPKIGEDHRLEFSRSLQESDLPPPNVNKIATGFLVSLLEQIGVSIPHEVIDFVNGAGDFSNVHISPGFEVGIDADYGGYFEVNSITGANIDVTYPVDVPMVFPAENTFGCGEDITISSSALVNNASMSVEPPFYNLELGPFLDNVELFVDFGLKVDFCVGLVIDGDCDGYEFKWKSGSHRESLPISLGPLDPLPPLINFCEAAFEDGADMATLLSCAHGGAAPFFNLVQGTLDAFNEQHGTNYTLATFEEGKVTIATPDLPTGTPLTLPEMAGTVRSVDGSSLSFSSTANGETLHVGGTQNDVTEFYLDLVSLLDYAEIPTTLSLGGGLGSIDFGDVAPTYHVDQKMSFDLKPTIYLRANLGTPMAWEVVDPVLGAISSGYGPTVDLKPGQSIHLSYPDALQDPTAVTDDYSMDGQFTTLTQHKYYSSVAIRALEVSIPGIVSWTALNEDIAKTELDGSPHTLQDHTMTLGGFNSETAPSFQLDPEKPILDITKLEATDVVNLGGGERGVVYRLDVRNGGDVRLLDLDVLRDFSQTFATATSFETACLTSGDLDENEQYDGDTDIHLLSSQNTLEVGQESTVEVLVRVQPEISEVLPDGCFATVDYFASSSATAYSPIGTLVTDRYNHCTQMDRSPLIVAGVDLGGSVITGLEDYTIYGFERVEIARALELSQGNLGSSGDVMVLPYTGASSSDPRILGDLHVGGDLFINEGRLTIDYLQLAGRLQKSARSSLITTGTSSLHSGCVATMPAPELDVTFPGGASLEVAADDAVAAAPGDYSSWTLEARSILTLTRGEYTVSSLRIEGDDAIVELDLSAGPIVLNIEDWSMPSARGLSFVARHGSTRDVVINYAGTHKQTLQRSLVQGTLYAPNATIEFDDGSVLEGACYAKRVKIGPFSRFSSHESLEPIDIAPACQNAVQVN